jgi:hypothetical protein
MPEETGQIDTREPLSRRLLFLGLGAGELLRILLLALVGGGRLARAPGSALADGAWLLVYLAPHAALASAFLFTVGSWSRSGALARFVIPAKLLGVLASAVAVAAELASRSPASLDLAFAGIAIPEWLCLAAVTIWDFGVLAVAATMVLAAAPATKGPRPPEHSIDERAPANPVYREADVENVDGRGAGSEHPPR